MTLSVNETKMLLDYDHICHTYVFTPKIRIIWAPCHKENKECSQTIMGNWMPKLVVWMGKLYKFQLTR